MFRRAVFIPALSTQRALNLWQLSTTLSVARSFSQCRTIREEARSSKETELYVRRVKKEHGENLPEGLLNEEELMIYERYFGPPTRYLKEGEEASLEGGEEALVEEEAEKEINIYNADGEVIERVILSATQTRLKENEPEEEIEGEERDDDAFGLDLAGKLGEAKIKAYSQLSKDIERAYKQVARDVRKAQQEDEEDPEYSEEEPEDEGEGEEEDLPDDAIRGKTDYLRTHPLTRMGSFSTLPYTVQPPEALTTSTKRFLTNVSNVHLREAAARAFGDNRLNNSPIVTTLNKNRSASFPIHPDDSGMTDMQADVHFATVMPGLHAQALSALSELRRRLGRDWVLNDVNRVLDVGTGGAGVVAWQGIVDAEESANGPKNRKPSVKSQIQKGQVENGEENITQEQEEEQEEVSVKATVITASPALRYRSAQMLDNTTFLPRLPDTNPTHTNPKPTESNQIQQPRKLYDLIIATNTLLPLNEEYNRKYQVENLWSLLNPNGGILLLIEKGNPLGFEAIAGARSHLLKYYVSSPGSENRPLRAHENSEDPLKPKEKGQIIAPCTNHKECPMFIGGPGLPKRRDYCRFRQRYIRPSYMQTMIHASSKNHEDAEFSFVAIRRGVDTRLPEGSQQIDPKLEDFNTTTKPVTSPFSEEALRSYYHTLPRLVREPIKKKGHIIMDLCTNAGLIERWTVPRSYGKIEYHDARKSKWGDLWALGAKTKVLTNIKAGTPNKYDKATEKRAGLKQWLNEKRLEKWEKSEQKLEKKRAKKQIQRENDNKRKDLNRKAIVF